MILYNVTTKIEQELADEWLIWMREHHIPKILNTGCFTSCRISQLLAQNDEDGLTYSIQYLSPSRKEFHRYQAQFAQQFQEIHHKKFEGHYVSFRTMMELIDELNAPTI